MEEVPSELKEHFSFLCDNNQFLMNHLSVVELEGSYDHPIPVGKNVTYVTNEPGILKKIGFFFQDIFKNQKSLMMFVIIVVAVLLCSIVICCMCCCRKKGEPINDNIQEE